MAGRDGTKRPSAALTDDSTQHAYETERAERNAAAHMVTTADVTATDGHLPSIPQIKAVAIVGLKSAPCYPCGACRQVLREFNCERVIVSVNGKPRSHDFAEILPHSFGPESL